MAVKWCNLENGFYRTHTDAFDGDTPLPEPRPGVWVKMEPPIIPEFHVAYYFYGAWGYVQDLGQIEHFGQRKVTKGNFRDRFTGMEQMLIDNYEYDDVLTALGVTPLDVMSKALMRTFREARLDSVDIDPCDPGTIHALLAYVQFGLLTQERALQILTP